METPVEYNAGKKEEKRILIEQENDHCAKCQSYPNCDNCDYWFKSMTRQEAIEKMAKANWIATVCAKNQCVPFDITKEQWDEEWEKLRIDYKKVYYAGAEAALNSLLGE